MQQAGARSSAPTCCSCVRAPLGESLSPPLLSPQLPFPKEKKRRTRSGEEGRRHYRKAGRSTTFAHAILLQNRAAHGHFRSRSERIWDQTRSLLKSPLSGVRDAGPALCGHNNGQNNYCKSNVVNKTAEQIPSFFFLFFFYTPEFLWRKKKRSFVWTAPDCSSTWNIYFYLSRVLLQRKGWC